MPHWTQQQHSVISSPSRQIICSAAAGSGKTAVMVERIARMIHSGLDPESFLVVTFTNSAAADTRNKIRARLWDGREDPLLRKALEKIDIMEISTIHSFCQHLIRQEFQAAGVDPFFAVCDSARASRLFSQSFRSACNSFSRWDRFRFASSWSMPDVFCTAARAASTCFSSGSSFSFR